MIASSSDEYRLRVDQSLLPQPDSVDHTGADQAGGALCAAK
jgi:hypothetical protein